MFGRASSFFLLSVAVTSAVKGASYTSSILYPLTLPAGYTVPYPSGFSQTSAGGQVAGSAAVSGNDRAYVWSPRVAGGVDLSLGLPAGTVKSYAVATDGAQQVGYGEATGGAYTDQAMMWSGSSGTVINLNPVLLPGISSSEAMALAPGQQVGYGLGDGTGGFRHAIAWAGSANSAVDLNPAALGIITSQAFGTDGTRQVGEGSGPGTGGSNHALFWNGSADTGVDLNPSAMGVENSHAFAVSGNQQVGKATGSGTSNATHAMLWTGTAASAIDLNPTNLTYIDFSEADGTNGSQQVGVGFGNGIGNLKHALLWSGTAGSAVDLHTLLPASGGWTTSYANTIDHSGNVFGIAYGTLNNVTGYFGVEWTPIGSASDIGSGNLVLAGASLATVTDQIKQGYDGGTWSGTAGITSSTAAGDSTHLTAVGVIQNNQSGSAIYSAANPFEGKSPGASDVLVKYTYYGDTNLDGKVDGSDYSRMDAAVLANAVTPGAMTGWFNGDFNYDGTINGSDYTLIDNTFNRQGAVITDLVASGSAVPEPVGMGVAGLVASAMLGRRRRIG